MKTNISKIAIIGAGQLGSRHLQAFALIDIPVSVYVIDPNKKSLEIAKMRYSEVTGDSNNDISIDYYTDMESLPHQLDVAIISTNSDVRKEVLEKLLLLREVKYAIIEKFLFQKEEDYIYISSLLKDKGIKAYVNCARRMWPFYKGIKKYFNDIKYFDYFVSGSNLGIGSNAIHFIDQIAFLTGDNVFSINCNFLDQEIQKSKRQGFIEFTGKLIGESQRGYTFNMSSYTKPKIPLVIQINSDKARVVIQEVDEVAWISSESNSWKWEQKSFSYLYQSQLTHLAVEQLVEKGNCDLPTYEESAGLHLQLLKSFIQHIDKSQGKGVIRCPLT